VSKILVIDDNPLVLSTLGRVLESAGYEIVLADGGPSGIDAFKSDAPDLVVTDIVMPEKDGIATIRAIIEEKPSAKIIAISGGYRFAGKEDDPLELAYRVGASEVMRKPFDPDRLLAATKKLIA
jgi:CheY-like chemotaxis protein